MNLVVPPEPLSQLVLQARESKALLFWQSPVDAEFEPEVISATFGYAEAYLAKLRSVGGGPAFVKAGRYVWYRKSDVLTWRAASTVSAANTGHAEQLKAARNKHAA